MAATRERPDVETMFEPHLEFLNCEIESARASGLYAASDDARKSGPASDSNERTGGKVSFESAAGFLGTLIGGSPLLFVPFVIMAGLFYGAPLDSSVIIIMTVMGLIGGSVGRASGRLAGTTIGRQTKDFGIIAGLFLSVVLGALWGAVSGASAGILLMVLGAIPGAVIGAFIGLISMPLLFGAFQVLGEDNLVARNQFYPVAFGIWGIWFFAILGQFIFRP